MSSLKDSFNELDRKFPNDKPVQIRKHLFEHDGFKNLHENVGSAGHTVIRQEEQKK